MGILFAANLLATLGMVGWTQKRLADALNITEGAVSHYIKGTREPSSVTLAKIASTLGVTVDDLVGRESNDDVEKSIEIIERNAKNITKEQKRRIMEILIDVD